MTELPRGPITSDRLALAGELSPALSTSRTQTRGTAGLATLPTRVSSAILGLSTTAFSRLQASTVLSDLSRLTSAQLRGFSRLTARPLHAPFYRAGETRFGL